MLKVYYIITLLLNYLAPIILKYRILKKKEDTDRYVEKLGKYKINLPHKIIWFHASSLGELKSVENFIKSVMSDLSDNNYKALITTSTKSSGDYAKKISSEQIIHQYAPIDTPQIVKKFLSHWKQLLKMYHHYDYY